MYILKQFCMGRYISNDFAWDESALYVIILYTYVT